MLQRLVFWLCLPVVVVQGLWVRRRALRFPAAAGPDTGSAGTGEPALELSVVGDSIAAGVGAATLNDALAGHVARRLARRLGRTVRWSALGISGARSDDVRSRLVPRVGPEADVVIVSAGVNDATTLRRSNFWRARLGVLLDDLRARCPAALVVLVGLPPLSGFPLLPWPLRSLFGLRAATFNAVARAETARRTGCLFVPTDFEPRPGAFSDDGFHPSAASYGVWGEELADRILPALEAGWRTAGAAPDVPSTAGPV